jgi:hypothetical protein
MRKTMHSIRLQRPLVAVLAALLVASCGPGSPATSTPACSDAPYVSYVPSGRPSTTAKISIVSPTPNEVITGSTVHVVVAVTGATVVDDTNEDIRPDQGHVHVYLDNTLWYMQYSLTKDIPVHPGTYTVKAEFVANDHAPFNPRDWSTQVFFTVK